MSSPVSRFWHQSTPVQLEDACSRFETSLGARTPWEGGVYSLDVIFSPGFAEYVVPKPRFIRPLFHPNASPSGTWSYSGDPGVKMNYVYGDTWVKTKYDGPERFAKLLQTVQNTIHEPNLHDPAQGEAYLAAKYDFFPLPIDAKFDTTVFQK
ncbi:hypothetical protein DFH08DRAFT_952458 [Mycena albidolilacea]|uniref:UBC core domain-containing protein n=1 Tax=Mycena albidolilacea TaxID=1033008 RepID=A0AAD7AHY7_9AGAR|nr:hypothetical protein DFH08DRAFT_952458 [Mycena albidolilacea]